MLQESANKEKIEEQLLRKVFEATSGLTGEDFITELPKRLTGLLGMRYCFIAECTDEDKSLLHTVVLLKGEKCWIILSTPQTTLHVKW